jgi:hypothetical protein
MIGSAHFHSVYLQNNRLRSAYAIDHGIDILDREAKKK